jgi:GR25 family glycosyltransferase involved in LPS biosynthesis
MFYRRSYELLRSQSMSNAKVPEKVQLVILILVVWVAPIVFACVWLVRYYAHSADMLALIRDVEKLSIHTPTQGFVITMHNETGHKVAEQLKLAFGIEQMHVVMGHVGNYSKLSLYNRHLMRHGRTDGLQIGSLGMLGCMESHREVWTRVQQDSYIFEDDVVPVKEALNIVKMLLHDSAETDWSVIHIDTPSGFISGRLFAPDRSQFTKIGRITETCRDCVTWSARAYIITKATAQTLLQNYEPPVVQVDAYMSLLNAYHPNFKQVWSCVQAVDERQHPSSTQDYSEPIEFWWDISNFLMPQH